MKEERSKQQIAEQAQKQARLESTYKLKKLGKLTDEEIADVMSLLVK